MKDKKNFENHCDHNIFLGNYYGKEYDRSEEETLLDLYVANEDLVNGRHQFCARYSNEPGDYFSGNGADGIDNNLALKEAKRRWHCNRLSES